MRNMKTDIKPNQVYKVIKENDWSQKILTILTVSSINFTAKEREGKWHLDLLRDKYELLT